MASLEALAGFSSPAVFLVQLSSFRGYRRHVGSRYDFVLPARSLEQRTNMFYITGTFVVVLVIAGFFGPRSAAERMGRHPLLCRNQTRPSIKQ
jgi:hypothetical protein